MQNRRRKEPSNPPGRTTRLLRYGGHKLLSLAIIFHKHGKQSCVRRADGSCQTYSLSTSSLTQILTLARSVMKTSYRFSGWGFQKSPTGRRILYLTVTQSFLIRLISFLNAILGIKRVFGKQWRAMVFLFHHAQKLSGSVDTILLLAWDSVCCLPYNHSPSKMEGTT